MIFVLKIKKRPGVGLLNLDLWEISKIFLSGDGILGYFPKEEIHDYLLTHPHSIRVNRGNMPFLEPRISKNGEKYVASEANDTILDNLLSLPQE